jgi:predicted phage terminase large subunit-like protein
LISIAANEANSRSSRAPDRRLSHAGRADRVSDIRRSEDGGNYTAGVLMHSLKDGRFVISHVARGQWAAYERERNIRQLAEDDVRVYRNYEVGIEQEPDSAGKDMADAALRNLTGFMVYIDKVTGSKEVRANPFAAMVQNDKVMLIAGDWVFEYIKEAEGFPQSKYDDQIDASSGAFNRLWTASA